MENGLQLSVKKNILMSETWFTENTEIRTHEGWESIKDIRNIEYVLTVQKGKIVKEPIIGFNIWKEFSGVVNEYKSSDLYFTCKKVFFFKDSIWRVDNSIDVPTPEKLRYEGLLYSIMTPSNNLIVRSIGRVEENYVVAKCKNHGL